ncbi:MAG: hypothetical protein G8345_03910 [Magnetococcales bacterium]|nr:hypothetical protein [Magnetococcales bacterium]NGZ26017.1 hypothetical protein [Magnetococcales bacterium]
MTNLAQSGNLSQNEKEYIIKEKDMPESLKEIKETLGMDAAMAMLQNFAGIRLFIPKKINPTHLLCERLGKELASLLSNHFGGETLTIPRAARAIRQMRNIEITTQYDKGASVRHLASQYKLTERQIYTILSETILE